MIESFIQAYPGVVGWHDLMVHEYGPAKSTLRFMWRLMPVNPFCKAMI